MDSVAAGETCRGCDGPACDQLLCEPEAVLANRDRWPRHLCAAVLRQSTVTWAKDRALDLFGADLPQEIEDWTRASPLPVGRASMPGAWDHLLPPRMELGPTVYVGMQRFTLPGLSFTPKLPHDLRRAYVRLAALRAFGKAALILNPDIPFADVVAFGIVDDHPLVGCESGGKLAWLPATMQFTTAGWQNERVQTFCTNADRWWTWYGGAGVKRGRQDGSVAWTFQRLERALLDYVTKTGTLRPTPRQFAAASPPYSPRATPTRGTLSALMERAGSDWPTWRDTTLRRHGIN